MTEPRGSFFSAASMVRQELDEGIVRYIHTGADLQIVEYHFPAGRSFPRHFHESHEQMGFLVRGRMGFELDGKERVLGPGEYYHAPRNCPHRAWTLDEEAVLIDIFSPPRTDL